MWKVAAVAIVIFCCSSKLFAANAAPTVATAAKASPSPVTAKTTTLSVLGADDGGEPALVYTWATTGAPPAAVTFATNGANASKSDLATFTKAGAYAFKVTIKDAGGLTVTSNLNVTVNQTVTTIVVTPATATINLSKTQQYTAVAADQFGNALSPQPTFTWTVSGGGTVSATGLFTAGVTAGGPFTVTATSGAVHGTATVTLVNAAPTIATAAKATPSPVTAKTTTLSILGADDGGEPALVYTWATTGTPPAAVTFATNGANASKSDLVTFAKAGAYAFKVTIKDTGSLTVTSNLNVTVNPTLTTIVVTPATASINLNKTQQYTAVAKDQFGITLSPQPTFTWTVSGGGTVSATGLFTAGITAGGPFTVTATSGAVHGTATVTLVNAAPTIATAAKASPNPVTAKTTTLSVLGADDGGEPALVYTWATTGTPPAAVTFATNGINASKSDVATFTKAGAYAFKVTIKDTGSLTVTSNLNVTVNQTLTNIVITPATATINLNKTQQYTAVAHDQFGNALSPQPTITWTVSGGGTISATGLFTAGSTAGGPFTVTATSGAVHGTATVTLVNAAPTVATAANASPKPVTAKTTALSVLGADDGGEPNLVYTWATTGTPPAAVSFSVNGTNAAKNCTATFSKAGNYNFQVTIKDKGNLTVTSAVAVTVNQTPTTITVSPSSATANVGSTKQYTASTKDQFGVVFSPALAWTVTGGGTISSAGLFTAVNSGGPFTVKATAGAASGTATVTVNGVPTVAGAAAASPNPVTGTTTNLTVLGSDDGGEANLKYTWTVTSGPAVSFSVNGTNAAKNCTATFFQSGAYTLKATITDALNASVSSSVNVTVNQTTASLTIAPKATPYLTIAAGTQQQFTASAVDQFGHAYLTPPLTWSVTGGGVINTNGLFTAGSASGTWVVSVSSGGHSDSVTIQVPAVASVVKPASASPNPVTGTTTQLSVLGGDTNGEADLTYTWSLASGPAAVTFSASGFNSSKNSTAFFTMAGDYTFNVTITDSSNVSVTSTVAVTVQQNAPTLSITPNQVVLKSGATQQFTVTGVDQFGNYPTISASSWSTTGGGTIDSTGLFTADGSGGGPYTISATSGAGANTALVSKDITPPVISVPANVIVNATSAAGAVVTYPLATVTDDFSSPSAITITYSQASGTQFPLGKTPVTVTATDEAGNTSTKSFQVIVNPLSLAPHADVNVAAQNSTGAVVNFPNAVVTDYSDPAPVVTYSPANGSTFPIGTTLVTVTGSDKLGNTASITFHVTVTVSIAITPPANITVQASVPGGKVVTYPAATVSDPVDPAPTISYSQASGTNFPLGVTTVTVAATDKFSNASSATFTVTVNSPIVLKLPANVTVPSTGSNKALVTYANATVTDPVDSAPVISYSQASGTSFPVGTTPVTVTVTDKSSNKATGVFLVTVTNPLTMAAMANISTPATSPSGATVTYPSAHVTDTADPAPVITYSQKSGTVFPIGLTVVTVNASDKLLNTLTSNFNINVISKLTIGRASDIYVNATNSNGAIVYFSGPAVTDTTGLTPKITYSPASGSVFPIGKTPVTMTASDTAGYSATATFNVFVLSPLSTFLQTAPVGNTNSVPTAFSWTASANAVHYNLAVWDITNAISSYANFQPVIQATINAPATTYSPASPLLANHQYLWSVWADNGAPGALFSYALSYVQSPANEAYSYDSTVHPWATEFATGTKKVDVLTGLTFDRGKQTTLSIPATVFYNDASFSGLAGPRTLKISMSISQPDNLQSSLNVTLPEQDFPLGLSSAGTQNVTFTWDGTDGHGHNVPGGVYQVDLGINDSIGVLGKGGGSNVRGIFADVSVSGAVPVDINLTQAPCGGAPSVTFVTHGTPIDPATIIATIDGKTVTLGAGGSVPVAGLTPGVHVLAVQVTTLVVNESDIPTQTSNATFSINGGPPPGPTLSISSPSPKALINNRLPMLSAAFNGIGTIPTASFTLDGAPLGTWLNQVPEIELPDGPHTVAGSATDACGHTGQGSWTFTVDATPPVISNFQPDDDAHVSGPVTFSATFSDNLSGVAASQTEIYFDNHDITKLASVSATGFTWSTDGPIAAGVHEITVLIADVAGNWTMACTQVTGDYSPPRVIFDQVHDTSNKIDLTSLPGYTSGADVLLTGHISLDAVALDIKSDTIPAFGIITTFVPGTSDFSVVLPGLAAANYTLNVSAVNSHGNSMQTQVYLQAIPVTPVLTLLTPLDQQVFTGAGANMVTFSGFLQGETVSAQLYFIVDNVYNSFGTTAGSFSGTLNIPNGTHQVQAVTYGSSSGINYSDKRTIYINSAAVTATVNDCQDAEGVQPIIYYSDRKPHASSFTSPAWISGFVSDSSNSQCMATLGAGYSTDGSDFAPAYLSDAGIGAGVTEWTANVTFPSVAFQVGYIYPSPNPGPSSFDTRGTIVTGTIGSNDASHRQPWSVLNFTAAHPAGISSAIGAATQPHAEVQWLPTLLDIGDNGRIAIQKGDSILVAGKLGITSCTTADGTGYSGSDFLYYNNTSNRLYYTQNFAYPGYSYQLLRLTYSAAVDNAALTLTTQGITTNANFFIPQTLNAHVDVFDVSMTVTDSLGVVASDAEKVTGVTALVNAPTTAPVTPATPNLITIVARQPAKGPLPGSSPTGGGNVSLRVYAPGAASGGGNAQLYYDPGSTGVPGINTTLLPYNGTDVSVDSIDPIMGKTFYLQATALSSNANDVAVVLNYVPVDPSGGKYWMSKTLHDAFWVTASNVTGFNSLVYPHKVHGGPAGTTPWTPIPASTLLAQSIEGGSNFVIHMDPQVSNIERRTGDQLGDFGNVIGRLDSDPMPFSNLLQHITPQWFAGTVQGVYVEHFAPAPPAGASVPASVSTDHMNIGGHMVVCRLDARGANQAENAFPQFALNMQPKTGTDPVTGLQVTGTLTDPVIQIDAQIINNGTGVPVANPVVELYGTVGANPPTATSVKSNVWQFTAFPAPAPDHTVKWTIGAGHLVQGTLTSNTIQVEFPPGRHFPRLEIIRADNPADHLPALPHIVLGHAEIHSIVVEASATDNVAPKNADVAGPVGTQCTVHAANGIGLSVDAKLYIDGPGGVRGRVSLDGYPQNEYQTTDGRDLAQYVSVASEAYVPVYIQGYGNPGIATLHVQGQAFVQQQTSSLSWSVLGFPAKPVVAQWQATDDETFTVGGSLDFITASLQSTQNAANGFRPAPDTFNTINRTLDFNAPLGDEMVVCMNAGPVMLTATSPQPNVIAGNIHWTIQRNSDDTVAPSNQLPNLVQDPAHPLVATMTPNTPGSFRIICYSDMNNNNSYDSGEELMVVRAAIVRYTVQPGSSFAPSLGYSVVNGAVPNSAVSNGHAMELSVSFLEEGGGRNRDLGLRTLADEIVEGNPTHTYEVNLGNVGNLVSDTFTITYAVPPPGVNLTMREIPGGPTPMVDVARPDAVPVDTEPSGHRTPFRGNSSDNIGVAGANGGIIHNLTSFDPPGFVWPAMHPNAPNPTWTSTNGVNQFREFLVAYSQTFPRNYVSLGSETYSVTANGIPDAGGRWSAGAGSGSDAAPGNLHVTDGIQTETGDTAHLQVVGLSFYNQVATRVPPIPAPPVLNSPKQVICTVGTPLAYTITASNAPTEFDAAVPAGLGLAVDHATGNIAGAPVVSGTFYFSIRASNAVDPGPPIRSQTDIGTFQLIVNPHP